MEQKEEMEFQRQLRRRMAWLRGQLDVGESEKVSVIIPRFLDGIRGGQWYNYLNEEDLCKKASQFAFGHVELKVTLDIQIRINSRLHGLVCKSQVKDRGTLENISIQVHV